MQIKSADIENCLDITELYEELMEEISERTNTLPDLSLRSQSLERCKHYLESGIYKVFIAEVDQQIVGFISLCRSYSLYAGGEFGIIQEFFVRREHRSNKIGTKLLVKTSEYGAQVGWRHLEVTTPPLPQFDKTCTFYQTNGFIDRKGRKMKLII